VAADHALLDGAEHRLVVLDVDVDRFKLADLLSVPVDQLLALPLSDVLMDIHWFLFSHSELLHVLNSARSSILRAQCCLSTSIAR
jgi:hypothetical protein